MGTTDHGIFRGGSLDSEFHNIRKILHYSYTSIIVTGSIQAYLAAVIGLRGKVLVAGGL